MGSLRLDHRTRRSGPEFSLVTTMSQLGQSKVVVFSVMYFIEQRSEEPALTCQRKIKIEAE